MDIIILNGTRICHHKKHLIQYLFSTHVTEEVVASRIEGAPGDAGTGVEPILLLLLVHGRVSQVSGQVPG